MSLAEKIIGLVSPKTAERLGKQAQKDVQPFGLEITTGNIPGGKGDRINPSRNGAQFGDGKIVGGIFPSRNGGSQP